MSEEALGSELGQETPRGVLTDPTPGLPSRPVWEAVALVACLVLAILAHGPALRGMVERWFAEGTYYSHGPLIPLIAAWLVWRDRHRLHALCEPGSHACLAFLLASSWLLYVGFAGRTRAVQQYGFILALAGIAVAFCGLRVVRRCWFPLVYSALFMVPLAGILLKRLTLGLKLGVTALTAKGLELLAVPAVMRGDTIHFQGNVGVRVDDVCSGLRSLVALLALAMLMAHLQRSRRKAALIVVLAVPIAMVGNGVRIAILSWLAARGTPAEPDTWLHEATGYVVYLVSLGLLLALASLPAGQVMPHVSQSQSQTKQRIPPSRPRVILATVVTLSGSLAISLQFRAPAQGASRTSGGIPAVRSAWTSTDLQLPPMIHRALRSGDYVIREYFRAGSHIPVELMVLHSDGADLHPPDACYTLQGLVELERGPVALPTLAGTRVNRAVLADAAGRRSLVYFWYRLDGQHSLSLAPFQTRGTSFLRTLVGLDGVPVTTCRISTPGVPDDQAAEDRVACFVEEVLSPYIDSLP